ncbi:Procollagen galactosyltransferase [Lachnellula hyalina]|uniref:Procollagen galactosyltransferase n=1 Tax=Lachnellula hyalina TaxID=1316788 RepID=A0A8H8R8W6_9HELO|nr:Procollagen galactosyltransferase [Lachnellula hyalina]TVY30590.1 Procollagen galactosyltransferase [Lachnellula hyalina]
MTSIRQNTRCHLVLAACSISLVLVFLGLRTSNYTTPRWGLSQSQQTPQVQNTDIARAGNGTLGFEKVLVLGLKERTDKRDAMILSSSLTGFEVEFVDAVKGEDVLDKARPAGFTMSGGVLGSWRAHINAIRSVLERKLSSVLIMEDDVDWDVRIQSQMPEFAKGVRTVSGVPLTEPQESPYGDDWDILWPGHCGEVGPEKDEPIYIISNDATVAPKEHQPWLKMLKDYPEGTRIVHRGIAPICVFSYAVSRRGAQKLMASLATKTSYDLAFDNQLAFACKDKLLDLKCYSVEPMLFFHHRPAGSINKDSDIAGSKPEDADNIREKGITENIVWSARLNLEKLIAGSRDYVTQW